ncbi:acyl-homoserine-lactone synthase [Paucibacter sp. APW11]|uniref:Acyl-homoserine-lactone synthase n=1 Tax=Roseateles aquae TaxID=3077235 RepID=A0ABU3PD93_9BURK|nr:acyl-homoserine-lactone synthase [Paucibacter sp. APW11]MDT8999866.1 acyl-homoserine-lactone synthase [Paucibacter sp. APW11]
MNFVSARACELSPALYDSLAGYRYQVFVERLGWDLKTAPGYEQDQFDHDDTVHVVARNDEGDIVGCGRLLPTTESYLLESVFPELLNGLPVPRSEQIWELSRFAAMEVKADADGMNARRHFMAERVLLEALRFCAARGVTHLLAVSTLAVERLMQRAGVDVHRIGPPSMIGGQPVLAFVIAVNERSLNALAAFEAAAQGLGAKPLPVRTPHMSDALQSLIALAQQPWAQPSHALVQGHTPTNTDAQHLDEVALQLH